MYSVVAAAEIRGIQSMIVWVEADVCDGMPGFEMVGILSSEVREARERIRSAIRNAGYRLTPRRITVNLCPADERKTGTGFDLPMALAVLSAYEQVDLSQAKDTLFVGEIALSGALRPVKGILPMMMAAKEAGLSRAVVPKENAREASFVRELTVFGAETLLDVVSFLKKEKELECVHINIEETRPMGVDTTVDFKDINGQKVLRRACEVAAAGMHNLLLTGPPGASKTMAVKALSGILPALSEKEMMELAGIYSVSGIFEERKRELYVRPFRCPHYSITASALVGGGRIPKPGEISLAHKGVLFLDELTEYAKPVLEQLRQPLEEREVRLVRMSGTFTYPADFMLVAAMNPCGCGYYPDRNRCTCTTSMVQRHMQKLSRPLLDRIDMTVEAPRVKIEDLASREENEPSGVIRRRVEQAHQVQGQRFAEEAWKYNSRIPADRMERYCPMEDAAQKQLFRAFDRMELSARAYHRVIRVARTIADLEGSQEILEEHMMEALLYRSMDETAWRARI